MINNINKFFFLGGFAGIKNSFGLLFIKSIFFKLTFHELSKKDIKDLVILLHILTDFFKVISFSLII